MSYSVIIVGGGMAGIKTASDLYQAGEKNTLILEARDRLGGRLRSQKSTLDPKVSYDFGASWFHDGLKNPLFEKAKKLGNVDYFYDDGKFVYVSQDSKSIPTWVFERIVTDIETFGKLYFEENPDQKDITVRELCEIYLHSNSKELTEEQKKYAPQVVRMWLEMWDGISWEEASAKHSFLWGIEHLGRNAYVTNGYSTVFQNELDELPQSYQQNNIKLNTKVKSINYEKDDSVVLTTQDGSEYRADFVVMTAPVSILRLTDPSDTEYIKWSPALPVNITSFWPESEYGSLGKVVFEFKENFWPSDVERFYVLASELSSEGRAKPWQHPTLIVNYSAMKGIPSLVFLTQSPVSKQIEKMSKREIWQLFKPIVEQIATGPVKDPFNVFHTEWNTDPLTRGAYSAGRIGTRETDVMCNALANGASNRIRFAGAETMAGSANGCAHGAYLSGEREASNILKQIQGRSKL